MCVLFTFIMLIHFYLVLCSYVRHFLKHNIVFFGPFWRPLWLSALGSRLVRLMVATAGNATTWTLEWCGD